MISVVEIQEPENEFDGEAEENSSKLSYRLGEFEGPLDLLLYLIKKNEVNIYDIPVSQITEQYLYYLRFATRFDLDDLSDFHLMAANLLLIKSRMLLPVEYTIDDEIEDPREKLVEKLIEYQKFKKLSLLMEEKEKEAEWVIERKKIQRTLPFDNNEPNVWQKLDVWDLLKTFSALTNNSLTSERVMDLREEVSINEKLTLLNELMETKKECFFTDLIIKSDSLMEIVCAFLAVLEAVKYKMIVIFQNKLFGDVLIRPGENPAKVQPESGAQN
ncbi:MAG: segregation/condensation protein A [Spirochaetaceae bacterium]|jgi:segregation and condensation protein A|nr:segregation/condensation protein A [Spirochaetaceae bacterium]